MEKIMIIGSPGAGKSTFARKLRDITNLPLYYLDMIWHKPDQTHITKEEFDLRLHEIIQKDRWIIDGNYHRTLEVRMKACDTIILMDYPMEVCLSGVRSRIGQHREDMPWIESKLDEEFKQIVINFSKNQRPMIYELLSKYQMQKDVIIFKSREEAEEYLHEIHERTRKSEIKEVVNMNKIICFHDPDKENGYLSNWYLSDFTINGIKYSSMEQYMMHQKAMLFCNDEIAQQILTTSDVAKIKNLGRAVKNYDEHIWNGMRQIIVYHGLLEKFRQNDELKSRLLATQSCILAECAVQDKIWAIGRSMKDEKRFDLQEWKGQNLLGFSLMCVRSALTQEN